MATETASDSAVRRAALDPTRSFIVQAPAGSGKTELLIQRHLLLLAAVRYPEQVVAVTFTRKAAAEMRSRVLRMLELAQSDDEQVPEHRLLSVELAGRVLARDRELGWGLLDRPGRLRIETVDALNGWLADRLPIASGGMTGAAVAESADAMYRRAAEEALLHALTDATLRADAACLLGAADNSLERLIGAVAAVLPTRDQWLDVIAELQADTTATEIGRGLRRLAGRRLAAVESAWGPDLARAAFLLDGQAAAASGAATAHGRLEAWQSIARLLLTRAGGWRQRFTRSEGFGADDKDRKARAAWLIGELAGRPRAREALIDVASLPALDPDPTLVDRVVAARAILLQAVAELKVGFENAGAVDFLELALGARNALGAVDAPSELLLALDRRIEHVLVDEFQDTSHSQYRLLELLTSGWTEGDGRTLFLVGDPMQSIYRFRDADMTLFLRAKSEGIGNVRLEQLVLRSNFRSEPAVVDWVNRTFGDLFPSYDDADAGRAAYYPFEANRASTDGSVALHRVATAGLAEQHAIVARLATDALASTSSATVAVLVQSRSHLRGLRTALDRFGVPARAVELDSLTESAVVQDLLGLTRALLHPADRIAWLAVLRSPWCGLSWSELHAVAAAAGERTILELIAGGEAAHCIGDGDAARRVEFVAERLGRGLALRGRLPLPRWIECCWQLLDGPATLEDEDDLERAQRFFAVLSTVIVDGDVPDTVELARALDVPFSPGAASGAAARERAIEIMTIHRAKGLEFDTVILFGLDKRPRTSDSRLLYWQQLREPGSAPACLLATITATGDPLTQLLKRADRELDRAERARLLYVAVTRARRHLHLVGHLAEGKDAAPKAGNDTLMSWLAPQFAAVDFAEGGEPVAAAARDWFVPMLTALDPADDIPCGPLAALPPEPPVERKDYEWASLTAAHIGTVVHRALQLAGGIRRDGDPVDASVGSPGRLRRELELLGVPSTELESASARAAETLERVFADDRGRWILAPRASASSELELAVVAEGRISHIKIDRTFVDDDGVRWIIDYKTSRHSGGDLDRFVDAEVTRYRAQLETYARAMYELDPAPIRVGLYFALLGVFRGWTPAVCAGADSAMP